MTLYLSKVIIALILCSQLSCADIEVDVPVSFSMTENGRFRFHNDGHEFRSLIEAVRYGRGPLKDGEIDETVYSISLSTNDEVTIDQCAGEIISLPIRYYVVSARIRGGEDISTKLYERSRILRENAESEIVKKHGNDIKQSKYFYPLVELEVKVEIMLELAKNEKDASGNDQR